jgi:hypothetical protein
MATTFSSYVYSFGTDTEFPKEITVPFTSVLCANISCSGANSVKYKVVSDGSKSEISPGENKIINSEGTAINDSIEFTFSRPSSIEIVVVKGQSLQDGFSGNVESTSFVEIIDPGEQTVDNSLSYTLEFNGSGGKVSGVEVPDKFILSYSATFRNEVSGITFEVPTAEDSNGYKRVLIAYSKL